MSFYQMPSRRLYWERVGWRRGFAPVAGVDEAGRGPLAGPVVAAAVVLPRRKRFSCRIIDSKKLGPAQREEVYQYLKRLAGIAIGVGIVDQVEIDRINILEATRQAMKMALARLPRLPSFLLLDGSSLPGVAIPQQALIRGEDRSVSIAAASIVAKVTRDRIMIELDRIYPRYGFARHKGYGTKEHLARLRRYGPCPIHRFSFRPVREASGGISSP